MTALFSFAAATATTLRSLLSIPPPAPPRPLSSTALLSVIPLTSAPLSPVTHVVAKLSHMQIRGTRETENDSLHPHLHNLSPSPAIPPTRLSVLSVWLSVGLWVCLFHSYLLICMPSTLSVCFRLDVHVSTVQPVYLGVYLYCLFLSVCGSPLVSRSVCFPVHCPSVCPSRLSVCVGVCFVVCLWLSVGLSVCLFPVTCLTV